MPLQNLEEVIRILENTRTDLQSGSSSEAIKNEVWDRLLSEPGGKRVRIAMKVEPSLTMAINNLLEEQPSKYNEQEMLILKSLQALTNNKIRMKGKEPYFFGFFKGNPEVVEDSRQLALHEIDNMLQRLYALANVSERTASESIEPELEEEVEGTEFQDFASRLGGALNPASKGAAKAAESEAKRAAEEEEERSRMSSSSEPSTIKRSPPPSAVPLFNIGAGTSTLKKTGALSALVPGSATSSSATPPPPPPSRMPPPASRPPLVITAAKAPLAGGAENTISVKDAMNQFIAKAKTSALTDPAKYQMSSDEAINKVTFKSKNPPNPILSQISFQSNAIIVSFNNPTLALQDPVLISGIIEGLQAADNDLQIFSLINNKDDAEEKSIHDAILGKFPDFLLTTTPIPPPPSSSATPPVPPPRRPPSSVLGASSATPPDLSSRLPPGSPSPRPFSPPPQPMGMSRRSSIDITASHVPPAPSQPAQVPPPVTTSDRYNKFLNELNKIKSSSTHDILQDYDIHPTPNKLVELKHTGAAGSAEAKVEFKKDKIIAKVVDADLIESIILGMKAADPNLNTFTIKCENPAEAQSIRTAIDTYFSGNKKIEFITTNSAIKALNVDTLPPPPPSKGSWFGFGRNT